MKNWILTLIVVTGSFANAANNKKLAEQVAGDNAVKMAEANKSRTCEAKKIEQMFIKPAAAGARVHVGDFRVWVECNDGAKPRYMAKVYKVKFGTRWIYKAEVEELELK